MRFLRISPDSKTDELSSSIARYLYEDQRIILEATGSTAIRQMIQAIIRARRVELEKDAEIIFATNVQSDKKEGEGPPLVRLTLAFASQSQTSAAPGGDPAQTIEGEIQEQFADWQVLPDEHNELLEKIRLHHSESPILSGGDVDAAWDQADVGDETVGGTAPTPDQDVVGELGEAVGLTYEDDEPLRSGEILEERDRHRWELDPASDDEQASQ